MARVALLLGSFMLTFALLSVVAMVSLGRPGAAAQPTPSRSPYSMASQTPAPSTPSSEPTLAPIATIEPTPAATGFATQVVVVAGAAFVESQVPDGGSINPAGDGIVIETTQDGPDSLWVTYRLDPAELPAGAQVLNVDTRVCGNVAGQSWDLSGPLGGTPTEYRTSQPDADGCWHFTDAPADDVSVTASVTLVSSLSIDKVEFTVRFVP